MNSQERVLAAGERTRTDRPATSLRFTPEALESMRVHLELPESDNLLNNVLDELDVDVRWVPVPFIGPKDKATPMLGGEGTDFWGIQYQRAQTLTNLYFEFSYHPLATATTVDDIENYDWPSLDWWDYEAVPELIERAHSKERRCAVLFVGGAFESPWYMRGMEQFLIDLHTAPELAEAICRKVQGYYSARAERILAATEGMIDVIYSGGDLGEQRQMLLNPDLWRERIKPFTAKLITPFKEMGFKTMYHSDGAIVPVIDDLIEIGLDFLDPVQTKATGMTPEELSPRFGQRLSFHGAIDEVELLNHATAEEVYAETTRVIDILGQQGGLIVSATHVVQGDVPPENIVAMIKATQAYRWSDDE